MYLTTTRRDILFPQKSEFQTPWNFDSDWGGSTGDMKSTSGYCFTFGSGCFSWCSKRQEIGAQSPVEAEFIAAATVNQALWVRKILISLQLEQEKSTEILVDNQAAIAISKDPVFHGRTKHLNIKFYFLREVYKTVKWFTLLQIRESSGGHFYKVISFTPAQATTVMDLIEGRWEEWIGEMPLKMTYPALEGHEWRIVTGFDPKNNVLFQLYCSSTYLISLKFNKDYSSDSIHLAISVLTTLYPICIGFQASFVIVLSLLLH
ncbi:hypothetical protein MTR67_012369 [Solanum verrucosum]|uniref:Alkaline/neutral invertase n=1 Tax=Solanum verrucosum TaxID=315347 RepID=A0AAF0THG0_SOLVR|nr:hypothetical protein MTR67_012369 [Solanum verrucosum]